MWEVILTNQQHKIVEATDLVDLMKKCPDALYVKQIG